MEAPMKSYFERATENVKVEFSDGEKTEGKAYFFKRGKTEYVSVFPDDTTVETFKKVQNKWTHCQVKKLTAIISKIKN